MSHPSNKLERREFYNKLKKQVFSSVEKKKKRKYSPSEEWLLKYYTVNDGRNLKRSSKRWCHCEWCIEDLTIQSTRLKQKLEDELEHWEEDWVWDEETNTSTSILQDQSIAQKLSS